MNIKDDFKLIFNSKSITIPEELTDEEKSKYAIKIYKRKKELHEKLGALGFREIVFKLERLKLKVMKKICPNFVVYYEKWCDFNTKRMIGKAKSSEEAELIELVNKISKLKTKKEWNKEENRNYHIDNKYPTQIINYLNWNKAIHQKNLKNDVVAISLLSLGTYYSLPLMLPLLIVSCASTIIDLECINLQEHSIAEYKICKPLLIKKENKEILKRKNEYLEAKKIVGEATLNNRKILTVEEVVSSIKTKEQAEEIKKWAMSMQNRNNLQNSKKKSLIK